MQGAPRPVHPLPKGAVINLLCGLTGSGKTSLITQALGFPRIDHSARSDTSQCAFYQIGDKYVMDTPGFLDNRINLDRSQLFNNTIKELNNHSCLIGKIFFVCPPQDRIPDQAAKWLADFIIVFSGVPITIVFSKVDYDPEPNEFRNFTQDIDKIFGPSVPIITGRRNVGAFVNALTNVPDTRIKIPIPEFQTTATIKKELKIIEGKMKELSRILEGQCTAEDVAKRLNDLEKSLKDLREKSEGCCPPQRIEEIINQLSNQQKDLSNQQNVITSSSQKLSLTIDQREKLQSLINSRKSILDRVMTIFI